MQVLFCGGYRLSVRSSSPRTDPPAGGLLRAWVQKCVYLTPGAMKKPSTFVGDFFIPAGQLRTRQPTQALA
ncbi:hypothetical protein BH23PAT2_BH23PAT2_09540 [soil metagenome]